jgi:hypothetical protein
MTNKPTQILPEPINRRTALKLFIVTIFVMITISLLHAREVREQWKSEQITRAIGGYNEYAKYRAIEKIIHVKTPPSIFMELGHDKMCKIKDSLVPEILSLISEEKHKVDLSIAYSSVVCTSKLELNYTLDYALSIGIHVALSTRSIEEFPVCVYLDGEIAGWNDSMDRIGVKYGFSEFVNSVTSPPQSEAKANAVSNPPKSDKAEEV